MPTFNTTFGGGRIILRLTLGLVRQEKSNNRSLVSWSLKAVRGSYGSGSWNFDTHSWTSRIDGQNHSGTIGGIDFRSRSEYTLGSGQKWVSHGSDGKKTMSASGTFSEGSPGLWGSASVSGSYALPQIARPPTTPSAPNTFVPSATSFTFRRGSATARGSAITSYTFQVSTSPTFAHVNREWSNNTVSQTVTGLTPNTRYYVINRANSAAGSSGWNTPLNAASTTTLNTTPPTLVVEPEANGRKARLHLTPPGVLSSPSGYRVQVRETGTSTVTTFDIPTSPMPHVADALAGRSYDWRAAVLQGSYASEYTSWITAVQPSPNVSVGEYFDGASPARGDVAFRWQGTAHASASEMVGYLPQGWFRRGSTVGAILYSAQGDAFAGTRAVRADFRTENSGVQISAGSFDEGRADVAEGGTYSASLAVKLLDAEPQLAVASIAWLNSAGGSAGSDSLGEPTPLVTDEWVTVHVTGTAPLGAVKAIVAVRAATSAQGGRSWKAGEGVLVDAAFLTVGNPRTYFDGDSSSDRYDYSWLGDEHASASQAVLLPPSLMVDPLADPDCAPIPKPPLPPVIDDPCLDEIGTWRRYWVIVPPSEVGRWTAVLPTLTLRTGATAARQIRVRYFANPDDIPADEFSTDAEWEAEQIISYMPPDTVFSLNGLTERLRALVGDETDWRDADHLLFGTGGTPASWPELRCGTGYLIALDVPLDAPIGNLTVAAELTRRF